MVRAQLYLARRYREAIRHPIDHSGVDVDAFGQKRTSSDVTLCLRWSTIEYGTFLVWQHDVNYTVLDVNRKAAHRDLGIFRPFTGSHVVPPPMPGAFDQLAVQ